MKHLVPPDKVRKEVSSRLKTFFKTGELEFFTAALNLYCSFYEVEVPRVDWYQRLDTSGTAGLTYRSGKIELISPEFWKKNRRHRSFKRWLQVFYHEGYHYIWWVDDETKAEEYAEQMAK